MVRLTANTIWQEHQGEQEVRARMTGRAKNFGFLNPFILRKAYAQTAGFNTSSLSRQDESRGSGTQTDLESMYTTGFGLDKSHASDYINTSTTQIYWPGNIL